MVAASGQAILHRIMIIGIGVLDHRGATAVAALVIDGLRIEHDLLASRVGDGGAAAGIGEGGIVGVGAGQHLRGVIARAAVDLFTEQHAAQEVLVIGHGRVPALGAVVIVDGEVVGRADGPHLRKALVLGVEVVLKVGIVLWQPVIAHTVLVTIVLIGVTPGAAAAIRPGLGQPVVAIGGGGSLQGRGTAIGAQAGHAGHDLFSPGQVIRVGIVACAGAVVGTKERVVAIINHGRAIQDRGGAMGIVVGGGVADASADSTVEIFVEVEVLPVGLAYTAGSHHWSCPGCRNRCCAAGCCSQR